MRYYSIFIFLLSLNSFSSERIESIYKNISESTKIYLKPGLASVLELPQNILEVRVGNPSELKVLISTVSPKEITLYFKNSHSRSTNLIIRADRKMYVFDVIPSELKHQDYVKVSQSIGIVRNSSALQVLESSAIKPHELKTEITNKKLITSKKLGI